MFNEKRFFEVTFDSALAVPFISDEGRNSEPAYANYATIVAAREILETYGVVLDIKPDEDPKILREQFLAGKKCFPAKIISDKNAPIPLKPDNALPSEVSYHAPQTIEEQQRQEMGVITFEDGESLKIRITRVDEKDSRPVNSKMVLTVSKGYEDGAIGVVRVTIPTKFSSNRSGEVSAATAESLYYNKESMQRVHFEDSERSPFTTYGDPYEIITSEMEARNIDPDAGYSDKIDPRNSRFSTVDNQRGLTEFVYDLTEWAACELKRQREEFEVRVK